MRRYLSHWCRHSHRGTLSIRIALVAAGLLVTGGAFGAQTIAKRQAAHDTAKGERSRRESTAGTVVNRSLNTFLQLPLGFEPAPAGVGPS